MSGAHLMGFCLIKSKLSVQKKTIDALAIAGPATRSLSHIIYILDLPWLLGVSFSFSKFN